MVLVFHPRIKWAHPLGLETSEPESDHFPLFSAQDNIQSFTSASHVPKCLGTVALSNYSVSFRVCFNLS